MSEPAPQRPRLHPSDDRLVLELEVRDPEALAELQAIADPAAREKHAELALKLGLLAIKHARGEIDVRAIRSEGDRLIEGFGKVLEHQRETVQHRLEQTLGNYFDPESGRFSERVRGLLEKDGDLARRLESAVGREDSTLARTLGDHFGPESQLMRLLSPRDSEGLLVSLESRLADALRTQRERILEQFSLDQDGSALSRLVKELSDRHGDLASQLEKRVQDVVKEFSLDEDDSALSRLVNRVDTAQQQLKKEFSLDQDGSALARMRKEMLGVFREAEDRNQEFRARVLAELSSMRTREEERAKSTLHGVDFEEGLGTWIEQRVLASGDAFRHTGKETGAMRGRFVGDYLVTLGPESAAPGARIVIEAKEDQSYTLPKAMEEIEVARKNREAGVGVFVFSAASAPEGMPRFHRHGNDVFVVWDHGDAGGDVYLEAGLSVAKALCLARTSAHDERDIDFDLAIKAILEVERNAEALDKIETSTKTIQSSANKILDEVGIRKRSLELQVRRLRAFYGEVKDSLTDR